MLHRHARVQDKQMNRPKHKKRQQLPFLIFFKKKLSCRGVARKKSTCKRGGLTHGEDGPHGSWRRTGAKATKKQTNKQNNAKETRTTARTSVARTQCVTYENQNVDDPVAWEHNVQPVQSHSVTCGTKISRVRTSWLLSTGRRDNSWWEPMPRGRPAIPSERVETIKEARRVACENLKALRTELKKDLLNN